MTDANPMAWLPFSIAEAALSGPGGGAGELSGAWTHLLDRLKTAGFLTIVEALPPKGVDVKGFEEQLIPLKGRAEAIYVPSLQGGVMRMSSWGAGRYLLDQGYETICEISSAHQNRVAVQAELLGAYHVGIENIMAVVGDDPKLGSRARHSLHSRIPEQFLFEGFKIAIQCPP